MYVSIRDETLLATGFETLLDGLRFYGLRGVELSVDRDGTVRALAPIAGRSTLSLNHVDDVETLGRQARDEGVTLSAFLLPNDFNAEDIDRELSWIVAVGQAAADLGVPAVRIDAIMRGERDLPLEERTAIFQRGVNYVLDKTVDLPVEFGIENHGSQGNDPEFLEGLLASVVSDRLGMTLDTGNFYWAGHPLEDVYSILHRLAPLAKHTHVKNIRYPEEMRGVRRPLGYEYGKYVCPITEGDIDHSRVVNILADAGYDRDLCLEDESLGKFDQGARRANIQSAVDYFHGLVG